MRKAITTALLLAVAFTTAPAQPQLMFDLSHGQFQDHFVDPSFYDYVIPDYKEILTRNGVEYVENTTEITASSLEDIDVLLMLSPLYYENQVNITEGEKQAIVDYVRRGGSLIIFVDEEDPRVHLADYGANDILTPFGIEMGGDVHDVPGNCGAITFENEIFNGRREVPYSGARTIKGGIPASVCMEGGYQHSAYVKTDGGGKVFACAETMVALLMGYPDGERNVHNHMETRWWGKDSRLFMEEVIMWSLKK